MSAATVIMRPLPIAPRPKPGELISSWLGRTAACYYMEDDRFGALLLPGRKAQNGRLDLHLSGDDVAYIANVFRIPPEQVAALALTKAWPGFAVDHLPHVGSGTRARGTLDLCWCRMCLEEGHMSGCAYLDREAALPLFLCHRHHQWRVDCCRHCSPDRPPRFIWADGTVELACGDCHRLLRTPGRRVWADTWHNEDRYMGRKFEILIAFEQSLRAALLGRAVRLESVGEVTPAEFLALVDDLTCALLAPNLSSTSLINRYGGDFLRAIPDHKPQDWEKHCYAEIGPMTRAWVMSSVIAIVSSEPISLLFSNRYWARDSGRAEARTLEWLFKHAATWVKAMLIRGSARWPARLRERMRVLDAETGLDVDHILERFEAWRAERECAIFGTQWPDWRRLIDWSWL